MLFPKTRKGTANLFAPCALPHALCVVIFENGVDKIT